MMKQNSQLLTKEEGKFKRLRQIILASTEFINDGIKFDTYMAKEKGFPVEDIADADHILTDCSFLTNEFLKEINFITDTYDIPKVYFIEFAKIIFILHADNQKSFYIFEEDLHKAVLIHKYMNDWEEHSSQVAES